MRKFLHAADVHLDSPLRGLERYDGAPVEEIRSATRRAFMNLVTLAIEEEVAFVLLAGDLYDGDWKDYNTGLFFISQMRRLEAARIPAFVIAGNHDAVSQITKLLYPPENVRVLGTKKAETILLEDLGVAIHGQGYASASVRENLSDSYPAAIPHLLNIGLLHTSLEGRPGHAAYAPCTLDGLCSRGYQYWALGHVHAREIVCRDPWVVFPGVLQGRHVREPGAKGATLVTYDGVKVVAVEPRELDVVRWAFCSVNVDAAATAGEVLGLVRKALEREVGLADARLLAVRVEITGVCPAHEELRTDPERWIQEVRSLANGYGGEGVWIEKVLLHTHPAMDLVDLVERDDALGGLLRSVRALEGNDTVLAALAQEFSEFRRKLPDDVFDDDTPDPTDPKILRGLLGDVEELLLARLLATREGNEP